VQFLEVIATKSAAIEAAAACLSAPEVGHNVHWQLQRLGRGCSLSGGEQKEEGGEGCVRGWGVNVGIRRACSMASSSGIFTAASASRATNQARNNIARCE
jgi:hypothetical protein